jgi:hypothetical protein
MGVAALRRPRVPGGRERPQPRARRHAHEPLSSAGMDALPSALPRFPGPLRPSTAPAGSSPGGDARWSHGRLRLTRGVTRITRAPGCEMMAKLRRRLTSLAICSRVSCAASACGAGHCGCGRVRARFGIVLQDTVIESRFLSARCRAKGSRQQRKLTNYPHSLPNIAMAACHAGQQHSAVEQQRRCALLPHAPLRWPPLPHLESPSPAHLQ